MLAHNLGLAARLPWRDDGKPNPPEANAASKTGEKIGFSRQALDPHS